MDILIDIRRRARQALGPLIGAAMVFYFVFHAIQGNRGILAWVQMRQEIAKAKETAQEAATIRAELEHRVALLRTESLDTDMLDERARLMLNYVRPGEKIIPQGKD